MGNMIAYVEVTWNEKENNNNFGYRFEVPIPLTFTTESLHFLLEKTELKSAMKSSQQ